MSFQCQWCLRALYRLLSQLCHEDMHKYHNHGCFNSLRTFSAVLHNIHLQPDLQDK